MSDYSNDHGFAPPSDNDSRPWLWTVSLLSLIYSLLALGARLTSKWDLLWYDDALLAIAYLVAFAHFGTFYSSIANGLGTTIGTVSPDEETAAAKDFFVSRVLALVALCLTKISVLLFARRIFSGNIYHEKIIFGTALALCIAWGILAATLSAAGCTSTLAFVSVENATCDANRARWAVIIALDLVTELLLVAIPIWFVSKNQIKASKKRVVGFVFSFRLLVAAFAIATAVSYFKFLQGGSENIGITTAAVWQEVLLGTSLITASIPSLRSFLWAFMSRELSTMYGFGTKNSKDDSIPMRSVNKSNRSGQVSEVQVDDDHGDGALQLRPDYGHYSVGVTHGTPRKGEKTQSSQRSDSSEQMIIHRDVEFEVR